MKVLLKRIAFTTSIVLFLTATSCVALVPVQRHDNGKHLGWYKKSNNSHASKSNGAHDQHQHKSKKKNKK